MLSFGDPYKVLQIDPDAEPEVVRAAYRALALKYHPDVSTGSQDRMAALNQAWGILRDAAARAEYDSSRAEVRQQPLPRQQEVSYEMPAPLPATPPGKPSGSRLDFGRYAGWSLGQVAAKDPEYLQWLARTPIGRAFTHEIDELLATHETTRSSGSATADRRPRRFGRA